MHTYLDILACHRAIFRGKDETIRAVFEIGPQRYQSYEQCHQQISKYLFVQVRFFFDRLDSFWGEIGALP